MPRRKRSPSYETQVGNSGNSSDALSVKVSDPKKRKGKINENTNNSNNSNSTTKKRKRKYTKKTNEKEIIGLVERIVSRKIDCKSDPPRLMALVEWKEGGCEWKTMEELRYNTVFLEDIKNRFLEHEMEIYVNIANIKEKLKYKIRKALSENPKYYNMCECFPFDPTEYKAYQVYFHMVKDKDQKFINFLENQVYRSYFYQLDLVQRNQFRDIAEKMSEKEGIQITIENDMDFGLPPNFEYLTKNMFVDSYDQTIIEEEPEIQGCKCVGKCGPKTQCCPRLVNEIFAYKDVKGTPTLNLNRQEVIIECNDNCNCDKSCLNRTSQQRRNIKLCLIRTENRGWGVTNGDLKEVIKRGTFIIEYTGEMLGHYEASKREETSYLFDLNMERNHDGYYTIDAFKYGSLARFVNHSCEPNSSMWFINDCRKDPKNQKLCIFADRDIKPGEEITIDYCPQDTVPIDQNSSHSFQTKIDCLCGSNKCKGQVYLSPPSP